MKGQGLDVILLMSWMKLHRAVLDIAGRLVHLDSPVFGKVILYLPVVSHIKASLHHVGVLYMKIFMSSESFRTYFLMNCLECHLKGQLNSRLSYNLAPLL
jgi:hypothetical protein